MFDAAFYYSKSSREISDCIFIDLIMSLIREEMLHFRSVVFIIPLFEIGEVFRIILRSCYLLPYFFGYKTEFFFLPKQSQRSRSVV